MSKFAAVSIAMREKVDYTIYSLEGEPVLVLTQATEVNKPYFNGLLRRSRRNMPRVKAGNIDVDLVIANRDNDRELYAKHVLCGWKNVRDTKGNEVAFSHEDALDFLKALPDFIFDEIRDFASEPRNFVKEQGPDASEVAETLGED